MPGLSRGVAPVGCLWGSCAGAADARDWPAGAGAAPRCLATAAGSGAAGGFPSGGPARRAPPRSQVQPALGFVLGRPGAAPRRTRPILGGGGNTHNDRKEDRGRKALSIKPPGSASTGRRGAERRAEEERGALWSLHFSLGSSAFSQAAAPAFGFCAPLRPRAGRGVPWSDAPLARHGSRFAVPPRCRQWPARPAGRPEPPGARPSEGSWVAVRTQVECPARQAPDPRS